MTSLLKQQLYVVQSSLGAVNNTLTDVEYNEGLLKAGINQVPLYMNTLKAETIEKFNVLGAKIEVGGCILGVNTAIDTLQRNVDLLIDSIINAQKGVLQPQVISPATLMDVLIKSIPAIPKDTALPFPVS
jgi:hypothetical protein